LSARSNAPEGSLEELMEELEESQATEEGLREEAERAWQEGERLRAEVHDQERLLESECWRGYATHRDLVQAHQELRAHKERVKELQAAAPLKERELLSAHAELHALRSRCEQLERSGGADPTEGPEQQRADALRWLLEPAPARVEFARAARELLPKLEERVQGTRRLVRRSKSERFDQRRGLENDLRTANRAQDRAEATGFQPLQFEQKSKRATLRLQAFNQNLELELTTLERGLTEEEDLHSWLLHELGETSQATAESEESGAALELELEHAKLKARYEEELETRQRIEREAMQAILAAEHEQSELTQQLAQAQEHAAARLRLEERVRELEGKQ